jgi:hypothetical protein
MGTRIGRIEQIFTDFQVRKIRENLFNPSNPCSHFNVLIFIKWKIKKKETPQYLPRI